MPRYDFTGRVALVTGAGGGIGAAIADAFTDAGADVARWDVAPPGNAPEGTDVADICSGGSIEKALHRLMDRFGKLDIVVNNAGYAGATVPVEAYDLDEWRKVVDINLTGTFQMCRAVVPLLKANAWGRIVNIASLAGKEGTPNAAAYSAAKAGVLALTKSLGKELAGSGVLVNAIAPAAIETPLLDQMTKAHVETMVAKSPLGRLGTVHEVSELTLWLASEACTFSTGAIFDLSGGRATY